MKTLMKSLHEFRSSILNHSSSAIQVGNECLSKEIVKVKCVKVEGKLAYIVSKINNDVQKANKLKLKISKLERKQAKYDSVLTGNAQPQVDYCKRTIREKVTDVCIANFGQIDKKLVEDEGTLQHYLCYAASRMDSKLTKVLTLSPQLKSKYKQCESPIRAELVHFIWGSEHVDANNKWLGANSGVLLNSARNGVDNLMLESDEYYRLFMDRKEIRIEVYSALTDGVNQVVDKFNHSLNIPFKDIYGNILTTESVEKKIDTLLAKYLNIAPLAMAE